MADRPGLVQKRLSPHRFVQIPSDSSGSAGMGLNDAAIDIPLSSVPGRSKLTRTGARKASNWTSRGSAAAFCRDAYVPPGFLNGAAGARAGAGHIEKTGLVGGDAYGDGYDSRRRKSSLATVRSMGESDRRVTRLARFYRRVLDFSAVTKYTVYILPLALVLAIPIIVCTTVAKGAEIGGVRVYWFFMWIEVLWLGLWVAKLLAYCIPYIVQFVMSVVSPGRKRHAKVLRALEGPIALVIWAVVALATFLPIMVLNPVTQAERVTKFKPWQNWVKNILLGMLICSVMFLVEKSMLRHIAVCYHRTQFKMKIKETNRVMNLLGSLYHASCSIFPVFCQEFHDDDAIISDSIRNVVPEDKRNTPLRFLQTVGQLDEAPAWGVVDDFLGRRSYGSNAARSAVIQALERKDSAEALARRVWMSFVVEGRHALYLEDIAEVLASDPAEAQECFGMLDRDDNGEIGLDEMILTFVEFGRARTSLDQSIHDIDAAVQVLDSILIVVALIIGALISAFFVTNSSTAVIAAGATALLGLCFLLSTTAQEILGASTFLFVKRPFNVGDRVEIQGTHYIVQRISLLYTILQSVSDHRVTQVANFVLNTLFIDNFNRAQAMHEQLTVPVNFDTTFDDIQILRDELEQFVRDKENNHDFLPDIDVEIAGVGDMDRLELNVDIRYKSNWSNDSVRAARRSKFMCALVLALRRINIRAPGDESIPSLGSEETDLTQPPQSRPSINRTQKVRRSVASHDHPNRRSPIEDEETHYQTPSASPQKRLSANANPGMQSASRQSSTGRRKVRSAEGAGLANGVRVISEPVPVQRPMHQVGYNPYDSSARSQQQRRFSYEADQIGNGKAPFVAGLFMSGAEQKG